MGDIVKFVPGRLQRERCEGPGRLISLEERRAELEIGAEQNALIAGIIEEIASGRSGIPPEVLSAGASIIIVGSRKAQPVPEPGSVGNPLPALEGALQSAEYPRITSIPAGKSFSSHRAQLTSRLAISFTENDNAMLFADTRVEFQLDGRTVEATTLASLRALVSELNGWLSGC